jgi:hypothetical protein
MCISGASQLGKADRIQAVAQAAIENFRSAGIVVAKSDADSYGDSAAAFAFLFPTEQ